MVPAVCDDQNGSTRRGVIIRTKSAPISYLTEPRALVTQRSGPLYADSNVFQPVVRRKRAVADVQRYPCSIENNNWPVDDPVSKNEHLLRSGHLGVCNDPYCTSCPINYSVEEPSTTFEIFDVKFRNGDSKGWAKRMWSFMLHCIPGVMNPHAKLILQWNKFIIISSLLSAFLDPFFFFMLYVQAENKCIVINWHMTITLVVLRSVNDFIYLLHILLQFRLAYVDPESRLVESGDLVDDPKRIARNYLSGKFIIDFFLILPLPQIIILWFIPDSVSTYKRNLLRSAILVQFIPRMYRCIPLVAESSQVGFIYESVWSDSVVNVVTIVLTAHVVGSCWYLFCLQRVHQCFRIACQGSNMSKCLEYIDCGHGDDYMRRFGNDPAWETWKKNEDASACLRNDVFDFGIYQNAVKLTTHQSLVTRYVYSLFWGFQQINTMGGNQVPSFFVWEVLFTLLCLVIFALFLASIPTFPLALDNRWLEMSVRRRDLNEWMSHHRFPLLLKRRVLEGFRFNWMATRGVNEDILMESLPEDLQREIRSRDLFNKFLGKVRLLQMLDEAVVDAIRKRLKRKTYMKGRKILYPNSLIDKMVFIIRGKMVSIGDEDSTLSEGDVCGEELLTWCLQRSYLNNKGHRLLSNRLVGCLTNVEAFELRAPDLEQVTTLFIRFLTTPRLQAAIRYESPYWRTLAANRIQVAWRCRNKPALSRPRYAAQ